MNKIEQILDDFSNKLITDLRTNLNIKLKQRSDEMSAKYGNRSNPGDSALSASIRFQPFATSTSIGFNLLMNDYWEVINYGRRAKGVAKEAKIKEWIRKKGIVASFIKKNLEDRIAKAKTDKKLKKMPFELALKQMDYLVRRKIREKGFDGNNFYSEVTKDGRFKVLSKEISEAMQKDMVLELKESLKWQ